MGNKLTITTSGQTTMIVKRSNSAYQPQDETPILPEPVGATSAEVPLILILIAVTMFLPEESSFKIGELRMTLTRLLLLLITPTTLFRFSQLLARGNYKFVWSDVLVPVTGLWMFVGPIAIDEISDALKDSGTSALEFCIPYLAARTYLSERGQAVALARVLCITIAIVGFLAILDEVSGRFLIRELVGALTGYTKKGFEGGVVFDYSHPDLIRGSLLRATSSLEHPILLGMACLSGLLMSTTMRGALRHFMIAGSAVGLALTVSSGPIVGALVGFAVMIYEKMTRYLPFRWGAILIVTVTPLMIIFLVHPNPLGFIFNHITFDPSTAYYRVLQWDCAGELVLQSPILGIGLSNEWVSYCELANTIDSLWLRIAMKYGIPGSILVFLSYVGASSLSVSIKDDSLNLTRQERRLGFVLTVIIGLFVYMGFAVFFWGTVYILTMFLMGIRAHLGALGAMPRDPELDNDE
jgi:O-antigen ligase